MELSKAAEGDAAIWPPDLSEYKPATLELRLRDTLRFRKAGTFYLLIVAPLLFTLFYIVLSIASFA